MSKTTKGQEPRWAQSRRAYVAVIADDGTHRLGIAVEGESGYYKLREDADVGGPIETREEAIALAGIYNKRLGLSKKDAAEIAVSSVATQMREQAAERSERQRRGVRTRAANRAKRARGKS